MKCCLLAILFIVCSCDLVAQKYTKSYVYQYFGNDSASKKIVIKKKYNKHGMPVVEYCTGYKEHITSSADFYTMNNTYVKDTMLRKSRYYSSDGNRIDCDYAYNSQRQKTRMGVYLRQKIVLEHYNKKVTHHRRKYRSACLYKYDNRGHVAKVYMTKALPIMESSYKRMWWYDDSDRVKTEIEFKSTGDTLSVDTFVYDSTNLTILQRFYPFKMERVDTLIMKKDKDERITEKIITSESPYYRYRMVYTYNSKGALRKEEIFDMESKAKLTHIYVYE